MASAGVYEVSTAFDWAGVQYRVGHIVDGAAEVVAKFPSKFTSRSLSVGNSAAGSSTGTCVKKIEVFDTSGASLGFIPVYDAIT